MRIISGEYKGRVIKVAKGLAARPTTDIAKEGIFNIIDNTFEYEGLKVLDLFSGTGSISYEFVSRGVESVTSVEMNFKHYAHIKKTISDFKFANIKALRADVFTFIKLSKFKYDIVFADPPYDLEDVDKLPDLIFDKEMIHKGSWLILEHSNKHDFSEHKNFLKLKTYGKVQFTIFEVK